MESNQATVGPKNTFSLTIKKDGAVLTLSSSFDSGNMAKAEIGLNQAIIITPAQDCATSENPSHSKGWFHFSVSGVPSQTKLKFVVKKMSPLATQLKFSDYFRPVFRVAGEEWQRLEQAIVFVYPILRLKTKEDDTELHFDFSFQKVTPVYFAYSFPFSYEECEKMLKATAKEVKLLKNIYYKDEIIIKSPEGRSVHLLTVTSVDDKLDWREQKISEYLFNNGERPHEFKENKRVVLITARVHPGESPSSHAFNGLLRFILSSDARAHFLRKNFIFKLVPMLNPDGVFHGHHRMDIFGQNLNRFYLDPDIYRQPVVYAVKKLGEHYSKNGRLCFYMDLHAHPQKKGNFIYGNSMDSTQQQVQTQLFARLLSLNCIEFDYFNSSFSKYHMNAKDKNEDLTKEGAGRVVFNTHFKLVHAYTLECGYTSSGYLNEIGPIENGHRKFDKHSVQNDELENIKSPYYNSKKNIHFTIRSYENLGKNILVSILDLFQLNPASRLPHTPLKDLTGVRQEILNHINKTALSYTAKIGRSPANQGTIKSLKPIGGNERKGRGQLVRAPSIESSKQVQFNKLRNRTLAKVMIGAQL